MKKNNRKWSLALILFASMISVGMKNQNAYVTQAAERTFEISTGGSLGSGNSLGSAGEMEEKYPTPNGISWTGDMKSVYGWQGWRLHLGGAGSVGHASLKLDDENYCITKVVVNARRYIASFNKPQVYVNDSAGQNVNTKDVDYTFDVSQKRSATVKIGSKNEGIYVNKIRIYYAANLTRLVNDITAADTCNEYNKAAGFRERYNYLTNADTTSFNNTRISDVDQNGNTVQCTALEKLEYMEYLAATRSAGQNGQIQSITEQIKDKKSIGWIAMIGIIIVCMSAYSIVIKRKWNKQK